ncbi:hypothetical protein L1987_14933 [Smallanthus sonchifolius]|uniref:Uncharacterized protein n=1 Tax=Smallanthus sonchifolius TaxID=185202 RepID=A0ACB9J572_9ASTR|nr:hypothetical protein L1987_14933 [Smallanthus sonchifolius]
MKISLIGETRQTCWKNKTYDIWLSEEHRSWTLEQDTKDDDDDDDMDEVNQSENSDSGDEVAPDNDGEPEEEEFQYEDEWSMKEWDFLDSVNDTKSWRINGLSCYGSWITNPEDIKAEAVKFFKTKYEEPMANMPRLINCGFKMLSSAKACAKAEANQSEWRSSPLFFPLPTILDFENTIDRLN